MTSSVKYVGSDLDESVGFAEAVMNGAPVGGGLYVPDPLPSINAPREASKFAGLALSLLGNWIGDDLSPPEQEHVASSAFTFDLPIVELTEGSYKGMKIVELFHGPTGSFKDFGARWLARVLSILLKRTGQQRRIVVATSGDTGSAVADAFSGLANVDVVLLFPVGSVSNVQQQQLTVVRPGVTVFGIDGSFDDCQALAKKALSMSNLRVPVTSANSINIGRLLPQMTYYVYAATALDDPLTIVVPSGNLGNLVAGVLAVRTLGLNARFIAAHNSNDSLGRYFKGIEVNQPTIRTISNAMDVGNPSNLRRLQALMSQSEIRSLITATSVSDQETLSEMSDVWRTAGYLADPHTAVGIRAARLSGSPNCVVMSTAHPAKFPGPVREATGLEPDVPDSLAQSIQGQTSFLSAGRSGDEVIHYLQSADLKT